jgi:hypothetical protein
MIAKIIFAQSRALLSHESKLQLNIAFSAQGINTFLWMGGVLAYIFQDGELFSRSPQFFCSFALVDFLTIGKVSSPNSALELNLGLRTSLLVHSPLPTKPFYGFHTN